MKKPMITLKITRHTAFNETFRNHQILLDGRKLGSIGSNETVEICGRWDSTLQMKIDWYNSNENICTENINQ